MIDPQTVEKIMDTALIEEVVSDFVTLRRRGVNLVGLCPFHDEKTGSFTVSPAKGIFKCFGCGKGGNPVHFIMEHEHISYVDALKYLARKYHIEVQERELSDEEKIIHDDRESMLVLNEFATGYFADTLHNHTEGKTIGLSYLRERGFSDAVIRTFQLGYSLNDNEAFSKSALAKGYKSEYLEKTGLSIRRDNGSLFDRFSARVMFPIHTVSGKVIGFGGRTLSSSDKIAKYLNSSESDVFHKGNELYGIFFAKSAIVKHDRCFLVEGYTDVISMYQAGVQNVVASSGTSLTQRQIKLIRRFTPNVTILYDGDAAGIKASLRGIDLLLEEGMYIKVARLPEGEDPDSYARTRNAVDFIAYINQHQVDFIRFKIDLLQVDAGHDPVKRAALVGDIVRSIALIPDRLLLGEYVKECSTLLNVEEAVLYNQINRYKQQKYDETPKERQRNSQLSDSFPQPDEPAPEQTSVISDNVRTATPFEKQERELLNYLVRYGEVALFEVQGRDTPMTVGDYILEELDRDGLSLHQPLFTEFVNIYREASVEPDFYASSYFKKHPNPTISKLAIDLMTDRYIASKFFSTEPEVIVPDVPEYIPGDDRSARAHTSAKMRRHQALKILTKRHRDRMEALAGGVQRVVHEYKNAILLERIKETLVRIKQAVEAGDFDTAKQQQEIYQQLNQTKRDLSKNLGERVVIMVKC
ncbi:MAG: DNA primase [Prevotellaceae bacterium]|jgi:DNA primase|nr:DNA primase [Prevotellaceae bacterium]